MENIIIDLKVSSKDYFLWARKNSIMQLFIYSLVFCAVMFIVLYIILHNNKRNDLIFLILEIILFIVSSIILSLLFFLFNYLYYKIKTKSIYKSNKLLQNNLKYIFSETGFNNNHNETIINYNDLYLVDEDINAYYFYVSKNQAFILPKHFIGDQYIFRNFIINNIKCIRLNKKYNVNCA